ncbi:hypothetical protein ACE1TH_06225 [Shouchella sp. JSM 1781072]|uniref:hypothetical protein n=1 Tax=Shouchella sp. JSM 1781072 TaxID=3344581 RepID=UPI0035BF971A
MLKIEARSLWKLQSINPYSKRCTLVVNEAGSEGLFSIIENANKRGGTSYYKGLFKVDLNLKVDGNMRPDE